MVSLVGREQGIEFALSVDEERVVCKAVAMVVHIRTV